MVSENKSSFVFHGKNKWCKVRANKSSQFGLELNGGQSPPLSACPWSWSLWLAKRTRRFNCASEVCHQNETQAQVPQVEPASWVRGHELAKSSNQSDEKYGSSSSYCSCGRETAKKEPDAIERISSSRPNRQQEQQQTYKCLSQCHWKGELLLSQQDRNLNLPTRRRKQAEARRDKDLIIFKAPKRKLLTIPLWSNLLYLSLLFLLPLASALLLLPSKQTTTRQASQQFQDQQQGVPIYQTVHVTRACEWKSNLFVPKSNDILFAQPALSSTLVDQTVPDISSVTYETFNQQQVANLAPGNSRPAAGAETSARSTILRTDSKALVLSLPIIFNPSFAGYEPACSIRLIVPRNMRILAKLSSRRLAFAQEQLLESDMMSSSGEPWRPSLWLNVSQNQFIETEHRSFESEANVLAFRFLLDRFAYKQVPDARFQVVLTAFQTLSENSDLSSQQQATAGGPTTTLFGQEQQFICDQQRLISANLACDGFKNCQDGHDEEMATCLAMRQAGHNTTPTGDQNQVGLNQLEGGNTNTKQLDRDNQKEATPIWVRVWRFAHDSNSIVGFLFGFLLILALLTCCSCCVYLSLLLWRQRRRLLEQAGRLASPQVAGRRRTASSSTKELDEERAALAAQLADQRVVASRADARPAPPHLQSILKRPPEFGVPVAPQRPSQPPPPPRPTRLLPRQVNEQQERIERIDQIQKRQHFQQHYPAQSASDQAPKRGALASQLNVTSQTGFKPTPARRANRPTRPVPAAPPGAGTQPAEMRHLSTSSTSTTERTTITKTGTQRVTTYEYRTTGSQREATNVTRLSESLIQRLSNEGGSPTRAQTRSPSSQQRASAPAGTEGEIVYNSTQSSLI